MDGSTWNNLKNTSLKWIEVVEAMASDMGGGVKCLEGMYKRSPDSTRAERRRQPHWLPQTDSVLRCRAPWAFEQSRILWRPEVLGQ